jgi:hypothetical protein
MPDRQTVWSTCLCSATAAVFLGWNGNLDSTRNRTRINVSLTGAGGSDLSKPTYFEPGGRSAKMPAAFCFCSRINPE